MMITPSNMARICGISARWLMVPEWPPPPAPMQVRPSAFARMAFSAKRRLVTSWKTVPPQSWTWAIRSVGSPEALMTMSTP